MKHAFLIFLLLASTVLAAPVDEADYISVVAESDGPPGVITAMNYAVAMQVHGFTFTGAIDTEIMEVDDLDEKFLVFIDGDDVTIVDSLNSPGAAAKTRTYFENLDYDVEISTLQEMFPELFEDDETDGAAVPELFAPPPCDGCLLGDQCLAPGTRTSSKYCNPDKVLAPLKAAGESCTSSYECHSRICEGTCVNPEAEPPAPLAPEPEKKNFVQKIFSWIRGLFS